jgi:hypothetical protein
MSVTDLDQLLQDYDLNPDEYRDYFEPAAFNPQQIENIKASLSNKLGQLDINKKKIAGDLGQSIMQHHGDMGTARSTYQAAKAGRGFETGTDIAAKFHQQQQQLFGGQAAAHEGFRLASQGIQKEGEQAQLDADIDIATAYDDYAGQFITQVRDVEGDIQMKELAEDDSSCFHGNSKVVLENGITKKVKDIEYGDMVQSFDNKGNIIYSKVVKDMFFNTKDSKNKYYYTIIKAGDSKLKVTARHRIFVNGIKKTKKARYVHPGDEINIVQNGALKSVKVDSVEHKMMKGKYDLFTEEGSVIVDNVGCTIFDGPLPHKLALWGWKVANKFRWFYNLNYLWYKPLYKLTTNEPV